MKAGVYTGDGQGLPQTSPALLVHIEDAASTLTFTQAIVAQAQRHMVQSTKYTGYSSYRLHPEMNKHFRFTIGGGLGPLVNLKKYNHHCT